MPEPREGRETYRARDEHRRAAGPRSARGWGGVRQTTASDSSGVCVTAVIVVRWKPSTRSRSLSGIFSLEQPHCLALARIEPAQATTGLRPASPSRPSSPPGAIFVESATDHSTSRRPVQPDYPWRTERARAGGAERSEERRLRGPYSRECSAVWLFEREYPAQRPPAARGLSSRDRESGAFCGRRFSHSDSS